MSKSSTKKTLKQVGDIHAEQKAFSLSDSQINEIFGAGPTVTGLSVSPLSAVQVSAVLHAVRLISEAVGSMPFALYQETDDGKEERKDHPATRLVKKRANAWTSSGELRRVLTQDALLHGAGYARVIKSLDDRPLEFQRLLPGTTARYLGVDGEPYYLTNTVKGQLRLAYDEVIYVPAIAGLYTGFPGTMSQDNADSPVRLGREAIANAAILERRTGEFFASGARPAAVIYNENKVSDEAGAATVKNVRKSWAKRDPREPVVMDGGWKYQPIAMTSTDAQFIENRLEQINEIARIFGVPPVMLYNFERATWSNAEQMALSFLSLCLKPWLDKWKDAYATALLNEDEHDELFFDFDADDLSRTDVSVRVDILATAVAARILTPNEARTVLNKPKLPDGDALVNPNTLSTVTNVATKEAAAA